METQYPFMILFESILREEHKNFSQKLYYINFIMRFYSIGVYQVYDRRL